MDRRTRDARATRQDAREALLEAAAEVFAARGFGAASVDEVAQRAGYSKGAVYWHFASKDELFFTLLEERVDVRWREMVALLESAPPEQDMAPEASRRFGELLSGQSALLRLDNEYWSQAVRDPKLRARYAKRQAEMRRALGRALETRLRHLGMPPLEASYEEFATVVMSLAAGLAQHRLIEPDAVPDRLLGETIVLIYRGLRWSAAEPGAIKP